MFLRRQRAFLAVVNLQFSFLQTVTGLRLSISEEAELRRRTLDLEDSL